MYARTCTEPFGLKQYFDRHCELVQFRTLMLMSLVAQKLNDNFLFVTLFSWVYSSVVLFSLHRRIWHSKVHSADHLSGKKNCSMACVRLCHQDFTPAQDPVSCPIDPVSH